jgi:hypothetical protein
VNDGTGRDFVDDDRADLGHLSQVAYQSLLNIQSNLGSIQAQIAANLSLPASTLASIGAVASIVRSQQSSIFGIASAASNLQSSLSRSAAQADLGILNLQKLVMPSLDAQIKTLVGGLDLRGFSTAIQGVAELAARQSAFISNMAPSIAVAYANLYPKNLRSINGIRMTRVDAVVMQDGLPLYGIPRASTSAELLSAHQYRDRRDIIGRKWRSIAVDCRELLHESASEETATYALFANEALDALESGHTRAAQALAGTLIDSFLTDYFGEHRRSFTPDRRGKRTTTAYDELEIKQFIAFAPIWRSYQQFIPSEGAVVPRTFSRHATAHTISAQQFSRRNAVQGVMLATSLIYRLHEELQSREVI